MPRLEALLAMIGRWERRLCAWRDRARRALLVREHPRLALADSARLEPELLFRLASDARVSIGAGSRLRFGSEFKADAGATLAIGERVHLGPHCTLSALREVVIGDDCLIAERVSIRDHDHGIADPARPYAEQGYTVAPVRIGRNVWIGGGVTILKGVSLGDNCVVGANAVVTRSFPANSVIAGVPARLLRTLDAAESA